MFKPQLTKPTGKNLYYIHKSEGYSNCLYGNNSKGQRDPILNVLPNCVGWSIGRFNEIGDYGCIKYAFKGNACDFIDSAKKMGFEISQTPTLGGIMVWKGGKSGAGHTAMVEVINADGSITTSESEWNGKVFVSYTRKGKNYSDGCSWMASGYTYLGCIVNPAVVEEPEIKITDIEIKDVNTEEITTVKGFYQDGRNYVQLNELAEKGYIIVKWDGEYPVLTPVHKCEVAIPILK